MGSLWTWLWVGHILKIFAIGRPTPCCPLQNIVSASPACFTPHLRGELTCGFAVAQAQKKDDSECGERNTMRARRCQEWRKGMEGEITWPAIRRGERGGGCWGARGCSGSLCPWGAARQGPLHGGARRNHAWPCRGRSEPLCSCHGPLMNHYPATWL